MTTIANDYDKTPKLNPIRWARFRKELLETGTYDPHLWDEMDYYQQCWTKDVLRTLKQFQKEGEPKNIITYHDTDD